MFFSYKLKIKSIHVFMLTQTVQYLPLSHIMFSCFSNSVLIVGTASTY